MPLAHWMQKLNSFTPAGKAYPSFLQLTPLFLQLTLFSLIQLMICSSIVQQLKQLNNY